MIKELHKMTKAELLTIVQQCGSFCDDNVYKTFDELIDQFRSINYKRDRETLFIAVFNQEMNLLKILKYHSATKGAVAVDFKIILKDVLRIKNSSAIVMAHNHPTGGVKPSANDINAAIIFGVLFTLSDITVLESLVINDIDVYPIIEHNKKKYQKAFKDFNKLCGKEILSTKR